MKGGYIMRLKGKIAIITGAGSGIGKEAAKLFVREGAKVAACDVVEEWVKELERKSDNIEGYRLDVTDRGMIEEVVKKIYEKHGKIDILVNNAGITRDALFLRMREEDWDKVIEVNLKGVYNMTQVVVPYMVKGKGGSIINTSSIVGIYGNIGQTNYAASKAGVIGMTKVWAKELGRYGIRVNAIAPGFIKTPMTEKLPEKVVNIVLERTPLKRMGEPIEVAYVYLFLASDESSFITGQVISVDGGLVI